MSLVTQVKLRDGTYVSAMECVRNGDWPTIERAFTELYEELQAARRTVSGQEAQPIYQVISRGVCQDVTKEQYDTCEGKRYERRIVYAAPIPATEEPS